MLSHLRSLSFVAFVFVLITNISSPIFAQYNEKTHQLYIVDDGVIKIYDENLNFKSELTLYPEEYVQIRGVSPSHDFSKIAVTRYELFSRVDIFSLPDFTLISQTEALGGALWSRDNIHFISWDGVGNGNTYLLVVNALTGQTVDKKEFASIGSMSRLNSRDESMLLNTDGLGLWKVLGGIEKIKDFGVVGSESFSPDGQFLALRRGRTKIEIVSLTDYSVINTIDLNFDIGDIQWTAKGLFATSYNWNSYLFDPFTDEVLWSIPSGFVDDVIWTEDGSRFYKMDLSQGTTAHDGNTGAFIARMMPDLIATFTPDPNWPIPTASDSTYFTPVPTVTAKPG